MKHVLQCSACKSDDSEEDSKDDDKASMDEEESVEKIPVRALHQNKVVRKTFSLQGAKGQRQQPAQAAKKWSVDEIQVCCCS